MSLYSQIRKLSFLPDGNIPAKWMLGQTGSDKDHIALVAAQSDRPNCVLQDSTLRAGAHDLIQPIAVLPLTGNKKLAWAVAGGVINDGDDVVSKGDGTIISLQASATGNGTYWQVGVCFGDSATGSATLTDAALDGVCFVPQMPVEVTKA